MVAALIRTLDYKHHYIAHVNLDLAYGESISHAEKQKIISQTYENLLFNLADFIDNQGIDRKRLLAKVNFQNGEIFENALNSAKPVILITGHYGNWELIGLAIAARYVPLSVIGRPLDSSVMNAILRQNREQFDIDVIDKNGAMRAMIQCLKKGRVLGILVDQNTAENEGVLIDFFGHKARHTPSVALLARKFNAIVIPTFISSTDHKHHSITFYPPIEIETTGDHDKDTLTHVQAQAEITEQVIRSKPDEWFWLHKRWKNQYEHLYR